MRESGILLPVFSLPSRFGIGDLGPEAYRFVDFLHSSGQKYWQILPLNPTIPSGDYSPYMSPSAFAGNTDLISPERMMQEHLLDSDDPAGIPAFLANQVDYEAALPYKRSLFARSFESSGKRLQNDPHFTAFCREQSWWLEDYALFSALASRYCTHSWTTWPEDLKKRNHQALLEARRELATRIEMEKYLQYIFFSQWRALRRYAHDHGIRIIGDMPLYVNPESADVWTHPELFHLDSEGNPAAYAGVPPDYFSSTGQLWKNPLYRWPEHERTGFSWWIGRFRQNFLLFDLVRIDHFRGLVAYWEIPAGSRDARKGAWMKGPGERFLAAMKGAFVTFPVIAEDLGVITPDVRDIIRRFHLPGMRVLQFAFTDTTADSPHAPHNLSRELILYTGTHDNPPVRGWVEDFATDEDKERLRLYLGRSCPAGELPDIFIRLAMQSVAGTVILPLQDLLGLGSSARINTPGTDQGNWRWRMDGDCITDELALRLIGLTRVYGRTQDS